MKKKYWIVLEALSFVFFTLILQILTLFFAKNYFEYENFFLFSFIVVDLSFVLAILLAIKLWKPNLWDDLKLPHQKIIYLCIFITVCNFVVEDIFSFKRFTQTIAKGKLNFIEVGIYNEGPFGSIYFYLKTILIGPIYEEILYRKIIFSKLKQYFSVWIGVVISAMLFSIGHFDLNNLLTFFVAGCISAIIYHKTKSLTLVIILHGLHNFLVNFTTYRQISYQDNEFLLFLLIYSFCLIGVYIGVKKLTSIKDPMLSENNR